MKDHIKNLEADYKNKREQSEGLLERLREFTSNAGLAEFATLGWETSLTRVLVQ
jgi:hypothetical protein